MRMHVVTIIHSLEYISIGGVNIILKLNQCELGKKYKIDSLSCEGDIRRRFLDLGLVPSTEITPVFIAPFGDPIAYNVRGTLIAIRKCDSEYINIICV